jgi:hypothetical protein
MKDNEKILKVKDTNPSFKWVIQTGNIDKSVAIQSNGHILVNGELTTDNDLIVETLKEIAKINLTR